MSTLIAFALGQFSLLFPALIIAILLVAIIIALYRKDQVRTAIWVKSSGFFLEANNDSPRRSGERRALPGQVTPSNTASAQRGVHKEST